jgi:uncharacterized oligopeptide transporter (OPT) family protein
MLKIIGITCATGSILFDLLSYYKQIHKTLKTKHSSQVSSTSYMFKISHYLCSIVALILYSNWIGLTMESAAFVICLVAFSIIVHYKPRKWKLFKFGK